MVLVFLFTSNDDALLKLRMLKEKGFIDEKTYKKKADEFK